MIVTPGIRIVVACQAAILVGLVVKMSEKGLEVRLQAVLQNGEKRRELEEATVKLLFSYECSWNDLECCALVEFIIITKRGQVWPFDSLISGNLLPGILYSALAWKCNTQVSIQSEIFA